MEALGAQGTSIVKLFSPILWHTQACVGSFYTLEFPVLLPCRFLFQSSRSYLALKAILAGEKKMESGRKFSTPQQQNREKGKGQNTTTSYLFSKGLHIFFAVKVQNPSCLWEGYTTICFFCTSCNFIPEKRNNDQKY